MARYMETSNKAANVVDSVMESISDLPKDKQGYILTQILYLYNLGIRTAPRATQTTVRLNAVKNAARNQPVSIRMSVKEGKFGNYNAINIIADEVNELTEGDDLF